MPLAVAIKHLIDFCYPGTCAHCRGACDAQSVLCAGCFTELRALELAAACEACGAPVAEQDSPCPRCNGKGLPHLERIARLAIFDEPLKNLLHHLKFHRAWSLADFLADRLWARHDVRRLDTADLIVPVPLHSLRHLLRGYNQASLIARALSKRSGVRCRNVACRIKPTAEQSQIHSRAARHSNMRHAFALSASPRAIERRRIVLVDDVMTTGATLLSLALNRSRAARVHRRDRRRHRRSETSWIRASLRFLSEIV